ACGNSTNCVQTITIRDTTPPRITCPPNVPLECPALPTTNVTGVATAQDGCSSVTVTYSDSVTNTCGGARVISRTWTATDACGNAASCVQTITVRDTTPPTITCPPNATLECPATAATNVTGVATAVDGCSSVTVTYSDSVSNTCGGAKIIARTWTARDACGNSPRCVQTITIRDTTPPTMICPTNAALECPAIATTNPTGPATDACGNSASCVQTITVRDTTPPTITCPTNLTLECPADTSTNATGVATAQDTCSPVTVTYSDSVTNNCGDTKIIARTWVATDACGNRAGCVQTI